MHTRLALGETAPPVRLPDAKGDVQDVAQIAPDGPLVVIFACNHCPFVKHVAPALGEIAAHWQDRGVRVVAISSNDIQSHPSDAPEYMVTFARDNGWTFPYLYDESQRVAESYGAMCTPDTFVFDGSRRLVYRGQLDSSRPGNGAAVTCADVDAAIAAVLADEPVSGQQRASVGCSIKWKPGNGPR